MIISKAEYIHSNLNLLWPESSFNNFVKQWQIYNKLPKNYQNLERITIFAKIINEVSLILGNNVAFTDIEVKKIGYIFRRIYTIFSIEAKLILKANNANFVKEGETIFLLRKKIINSLKYLRLSINLAEINNEAFIQKKVKENFKVTNNYIISHSIFKPQ